MSNNKKDYDINEHLSKIMEKILEMINQTTKLSSRNVKQVSILESVPIYRELVGNLKPNLRHIKNDFKMTLKEMFIELTKAIQLANEKELDIDKKRLHNLIK